MNRENTRISATFNKKIYQNALTNYTIALYTVKDKDQSSCHVFLGENLPLSVGVVYDFDGSWMNNGKYGRQFAVSGYREKMATGHDDVVAYLSSSLFKGIGKKMAERIYSAFGDNIFNILDNTPEDLKRIKGMSEKKYGQFLESYRNNRRVSMIYDKLKDFSGIGVGICKKIYSKYKLESISIIENHPYYLSYIKDIGFDTCDKIARKEGHRLDSFERFCAGANHVLMVNELDGNTAMDLQDFGREVYKLLKPECPDISKDLINDLTIRAIKEGNLVYRTLSTDSIQKKYIYRKNVYKNEKEISVNILRLLNNCYDWDADKIESSFKESEHRLGNTLDKMQKKAVAMIIRNGFSALTGGAGTGKTTTINAAIDMYEKLSKGKIELLAPTGRAARRITEITGRQAFTIHSRLHIATNSSGDEVKMDDGKDTEISNSLVVVDEASMIDIYLCNTLLSSINEGCNVVFVGDPGQLPSVGAGAVLRDIIESGAVPVTHLSKVYRQGDGSGIIENAVKISKGDCDIAECDDFHIYETATGKELEDKMIDLYLSDVKKYGLMNVACLCPVKLYDAGVIAMNTRLQELINPASNKRQEIKIGSRVFRQGDIVMELENHQTVMNGDIGRIEHIKSDREDQSIIVKFESGEIEEYKADDFGRLALAYAMTVHKAQGSEYKSVITCLQDSNKRMAKRNVIYTAITRGKNVVRFCGSVSALKRAIACNDTYNRKTMLSNDLAYAVGLEKRNK